MRPLILLAMPSISCPMAMCVLSSMSLVRRADRDEHHKIDTAEPNAHGAPPDNWPAVTPRCGGEPLPHRPNIG
jgi:hypothetical protein